MSRYISLFSKSFDVDGHQGYLDDMWKESECPFDWTKLKKDNTFCFKFPRSYDNDVYVCKIIDISSKSYFLDDVSIRVEVIHVYKSYPNYEFQGNVY